MDTLFQQLGFNYKALEEFKVIDVRDKKIKIKSFNHESGQIEFKKILSIVNKGKTILYEVRTPDNALFLKGSGSHRIWDPIDQIYFQLKDRSSAHILNNKNDILSVVIIKTSNIDYVIDLEVEGNQNYFSNAILSHNTTTGGNALKFYASQRLDIRREGSNKEDDEVISNKTKVKVIKNKMAPPFKETHFNILFGNGIDKISEIFDLAIENEIIEKSGSWFKYNGENIGQGEATAKEWMISTSEIQEKITSAVIKKALGETND